MITAKLGDQYPVTFTANMNLTGATSVTLYAQFGTTKQTLASTVTDPVNGVVTYVLDGTLAVGVYQVELKVVIAGETITFPTSGYELMTIVPS